MKLVVQPRVPYGRGRGGVRGTVGNRRLWFSPSHEDGRQLEDASRNSRGRFEHLPQRGNGPLPPPNLPQRTHGQDWLLAHACSRYRQVPSSYPLTFENWLQTAREKLRRKRQRERKREIGEGGGGEETENKKKVDHILTDSSSAPTLYALCNSTTSVCACSDINIRHFYSPAFLLPL